MSDATIDAPLAELCPLTFGALTGANISPTERTIDGQLIVSVAGIPLPHAGLNTLLGSMDPSARQRLLEKERLIQTTQQPSSQNAAPQTN